jgi:ariadne-1
MKTRAKVQCLTAYCDEVSPSEAHQLNCGHWFCNDCWGAYLGSQLAGGRGCILTTCMAMRCEKNHTHTVKLGCKCNEMVPTATFMRFLPAAGSSSGSDDQKDASSAKAAKKYQGWILNSFIEGQSSIKWCPFPHCGSAVHFPAGGPKDIDCTCGNSFCFLCSHAAHTPAPCDLVDKWKKTETDDQATEIWLKARTKECPNCKVRIEKNRACNHMTCFSCKHHFCWLCKGAWKDHGSQTGGYYVCTNYDKSIEQGTRSSEEKDNIDATALMQKYLYYYKRFKDMDTGIALTKRLKKNIEKTCESLDPNKYGFLLDGVDKLIFARRVMQNTYLLAYFLQKGKTKNLFEHQQGMLIQNCESLQDIMENTKLDKLLDSRIAVISKTGAIDKYAKELSKVVDDVGFVDALGNEADAAMDGWACSTCSTINKSEAVSCKGCTACRLHGEMDCKPCAKTKKKAAAAAAAAATAARQAAADAAAAAQADE